MLEEQQWNQSAAGYSLGSANTFLLADFGLRVKLQTQKKVIL